ncbi:hypothetical protein GGI22_001905, partial [Coemansia erecta]
ETLDAEGNISRASASSAELDADPEHELEEARTRLEKLVQTAVPSGSAHRLLTATPHLPWEVTPLQAAFAESSKNGASFSAEKIADLESGTEARINDLESEITKLRQEMRDIAEMRRDVKSMLGLLYDRYSGGPVAAPPVEKRALSEF